MVVSESAKLECEAFLRNLISSNITLDSTDSFVPLISLDSGDRSRTSESIFRTVQWEILEVAQGINDDVDATRTKLSTLIDSAIVLCEGEFAPPNLPATILSDVFDVLTISRCEKLFHLMEDRVNVWKRPLFFNNCKNHMLRMCNDLLRRLSKSQHTVFCGQILVVLAKLFPLSERSGLNIVSEFNSENVSLQNAEETDENFDESEGIVKVSNTLYRKFWSLQDFFRQPNLCYDDNNWKQMMKCSNDVLAVFAAFKLDEGGVSTKSQTYFAKYLTSKRLFQLELSDSNFRRCILIQFLIMFQYLKATVRFKLEKHFLSEQQTQWVRERTEDIHKLIQETPPDGKEFLKSIENILAREEHWNAWKNDNCPAFKMPEAMGRKCVRKRKRVGDDIKESSEKGEIAMGVPELSRLFNICSDHWEACHVERRNYVPSMEAFFEEAIAQADPAACIEEEYKLTNDPNWGWKALRILSQKSLHFFTSTNQPAKSQPNYLDTMVSYLAKDLCLNRDPITNGVAKVEEDDNSQDDFKEDENEPTSNGLSKPLDSNSPSNDGMETDIPIERSRVIVTSVPSKVQKTLTSENIDNLSSILKEDCVKLAPHMGLNDDDLQYIQGQHADPVDQARHLLTLWKENDPEEVSMDRVKDILREVGLTEKLELLNDSN